jgi:hypothetical protein
VTLLSIKKAIASGQWRYVAVVLKLFVIALARVYLKTDHNQGGINERASQAPARGANL